MADTTEATPVKKKAKTRSPSYPAINLEAAIQRARVVHEHERRNATTYEVIAQHWKSNPKSSASLLAIAALKYFGLLTELPDKKLKLSDDALRILLDHDDSKERITAIKTCALRPKIHADLWAKYGADMPSDATFRSYLIFEKKFNESVVTDFIKEYKDTISFAKLGIDDKVPQEAEDEPLEPEGELFEEVKTPMQDTLKKDPIKTPTGGEASQVTRDLLLPLIGGSVAVLRAPIPMSEENYNHLTAMLEAMKKAIVKQDK